MADRITPSDIIDPKVKKEFEELLKLVGQMVDKFKEVQNTAKGMDAELKKGVKTNEELGKAKKKVAEGSQMLSDIEKETEKIREKHYQLIVKATAAESKAGKEYSKTSEELKKRNAEQREAAKVAEAEANSVARLTARNKQLIQERNKLNTSTKEGQKRIKEINAEIDRNNKTIKDNTSALEQQKNNVGNYSSAFKGLGNQLLAVTGITFGLNGAMKLLNNVLMSVQSTGDAVTHVKKGLGGALNSMFKTMAAGDFSFKTLIENMRNGYTAARNYSLALDEIGDIMRAVNLRSDEQADRMDELRIIMSETETKTLEERKAAMEEFDKINKQLLDDRINVANKIIDNERNRLKDEYKINDEQVALIENFIRNYDKLTENELANVQRVVDAKLKAQKVENKIRDEISKDYALSGVNREPTRKEIALIAESSKEYEHLQSQLNATELGYLKLHGILNSTIDLQRDQIADALKGIAQANREFKAADRVSTRRRQEITREENRIREEAEKKRLAGEKAMTDAQKNLWTNYVKIVDEAYKATDGIAEKATDNKLDIFAIEQQAFEQDLNERLQAYRDFMNQLAQMEQDMKRLKIDIFNETANLYSATIERQLQEAEEQRDYEIQLAGESTLAKKNAEERYANEVRKLRRRQAIADKIAGLFNVAINTAEGIMNYGKSPITAPLIPFVIALGGIQAATILAQPIPKFYKGVRNFDGGMAIVGEQGAEIYRTPDNQIGITPDVATLMTLPRGTDVYTHSESKRMFQNSTIDIERLVDEQRKTRRAIASKTEHHTHIDGNGLRHLVRKGNSTTLFIDKYLRS